LWVLAGAASVPGAGLMMGLAPWPLAVIDPADGTFWFSTFAPLAYSRWILENSDGVAIPGRRPEDCEVRGSYANAWLTIVKSASGDSLFRQMFLHANPGGRLYALIGLARTDARGLGAAIAQARSDAGTVYFWRWSELHGSRVRLKDLAVRDSLKAWSQL